MAPAAALEALWLELSGRLVDRVAHEIKNPLNGLAVNLEVLRTRVARGAPSDALASYVDAAASELARTTELVESLLALARPVRQPIDLWGTLRVLGTLYGAVAAAAGGSVVVERPDDVSDSSTADPTAARAALALALESAIAVGGSVRCTIERSGGEWVVRLHTSNRPPPFADAVLDVLARAGLAVRCDPNGLTVLAGSPAALD